MEYTTVITITISTVVVLGILLLSVAACISKSTVTHRLKKRRRNQILPSHTGSIQQHVTPPSRPRPHDACLMCLRESKQGEDDFCGQICRGNVMVNPPLLLPIPKDHVTYKMVKDNFTSSWNDPGGGKCPRIQHVFKIIGSSAFEMRYENYRNIYGNEASRFHGTSRSCRLESAEGNRYPCWSDDCRACCIIRQSFQVELAGANLSPGRRLGFGPGIYSSSASNKAANFSDGTVFMVKVVLGRVHVASDYKEVQSPPHGYDSVEFHKSRSGGRLDETVVYEDDAIRPEYLIIFKN